MITAKKSKKSKKLEDSEISEKNETEAAPKPAKKTKAEKRAEKKAEAEKNGDQKKPMNTKEIVESRILKEKKKELNLEKSTKHVLKHKLAEDNKEEDKEIARLEKMLHIKKKSKSVKKNFIDDGLGDLLDFCDESKREEIALAESIQISNYLNTRIKGPPFLDFGGPKLLNSTFLGFAY